MKTSFVERTIAGLSNGMDFAAFADTSAQARTGLLQRVDPRVKVAGILALIVAVATTHSLVAITAVFLLAVALAVASRVSPMDLAKWVWMPVLLFSGLIALPAVFLTPGDRLGSLPVTAQGLRTASFLLLRAETAVSLSSLLVLTTRWAHLLKALRVLRLPVVLVVILGMTYRYIFLMLETALDMFESRESRTVGVLEPADRRRLASATVGVLLSKSYQLSSEVHLAMQSRGFRGEVYLLDEFAARSVDWLWLGFFFAVAATAAWVGR
ncbi:MAG TPA: cobalt ECF transporter T component CbiQ [Bryobacteraceae bacterium]|nr:cobalt ECF transporter T component CbiQ [Bryobacteraceae bacterium]